MSQVADEPSYLTDMEDVKRKETLTLECGTADGERSVPEYVGSTSWVRAAGQRSMPCASVQIAFRGPPVTPQLGGPHTTYYMRASRFSLPDDCQQLIFTANIRACLGCFESSSLFH